MTTPVDPDEWVLHPAAVWAERVDFVGNVVVDDTGPGTLRFEQLLFERLDAARYRLCCIPFFAYGYNLGDVVGLTESAEIGHSPATVLERADHWSFRVLVEEDGVVPELLELLGRNDAEVEARGDLVACSVAGEERRDRLRAGFEELEQRGRIEYETAWT